MRHVLFAVSAVTMLSTTILTQAQAEQVAPTTSMDAVTVYATRSPQSTFDVPMMVSQIETGAAGNALAGDVSDLLEFTPGVEVDNGPRRNGQVVSIRGFDDEAVITLIDGRRQNYESAHDGRFFVDPALLKSIEIVKGSSSAIYGGGGIGGVVAFETKDASDLLDPGQNWGFLSSFGYRSANQEFAPMVAGYGRVGEWDILGSATFRSSNDIEQGDGNELDTDDQLLSGLFKTSYSFLDFHTIGFNYQSFYNDGQEPNNGAGAVTSSNPIVNKEVMDHQLGLTYQFENPDNHWLNPKAHLYYNHTEVEESDIFGTNAGRVQTRELQTIGTTLDNQTRFSFGENHQHIFSYGLEIYYNEQTGTSTTTGTRAGVPDAEAIYAGGYVQDEISFATPIGDFGIIPAVRFDTFESEDELGNSQNDHEFSPKLALNYKPIDELLFFGSWSRAFRAPNLTELYPTGLHFPGGFGFPPDNFFVPNPGLKPETVTSFELGAGIDLEQILSDKDKAQLKGAWFYSKGEDFITQEVNIFAGTTRNFNVDEAKLTGFELEGSYEFHPLTAKIGLSYVEAEDENTGEYLSNNVPLTFVTDLSYQVDKIDSRVGWRGRYAEENDRVGSTDTPTSGYAVHDVYYRWKPDAKYLDQLTLDLGVDNLFDKAYRKRFATLVEEGRSYNARLSFKW